MCCVIGMFVLLLMLDSCSKIWRKYTENIKRGFQNEFTSNSDNFFLQISCFWLSQKSDLFANPNQKIEMLRLVLSDSLLAFSLFVSFEFQRPLPLMGLDLAINQYSDFWTHVCSHKNVPDPGPIIVLPCLSFKSKSKKRNQTSLKIQNDTKLKPPRGRYKDKIMIFSFFEWLCLHVQESSPRCLTEAKGKGHCCSRLTSSSDLRTCAVFFQPCCTLSV